jgi:hypothetical protein
MAGRVALVVGSQCANLARLSFPEQLARNLRGALTRAGWREAGNTRGLLIDPTIVDLKRAVADAFVAANDAGATLLIAFIGHGVADGDLDFYLMARDSPSGNPDSETAFHLTQFVRERLKRFPSLDGVLLLVDACQAQEGVEGAATRWTNVLAGNRGRMEMLVASGTGSAYDGCFTKTILGTFQSGLSTRGDSLLCADLQPEISANCVAQAQHLAYSAGTLSSGDPGLWLVPNIARSRDAVTGRPVAGLVDQLTTGVITTDAMRETLAVIAESGGSRLRLVTGAPGSGKSTLLALLIRPRLIDTLELSATYIKGAVFLDTASTIETVAAELAAQLAVTVPGFSNAAEAVAADTSEQDLTTLDSWDTAVMLPLTRCRRPGMRVNIVVDGLDQPRPGAREVILAALQRMTHTAPASRLGHVRVIAGVRGGQGIDSRDELAHAYRIDVAPPTTAQIARAATTTSGWHPSEDDLAGMVGEAQAGGWLIARLAREVASHG